MSEHEPGRELDALVAERVMGWTVVPQPQTEGEWGDVWTALDRLEDGRVGVLYPRGLGIGSGPADLEDGKMMKWSPSTDISAAFEVVENLRANGLTIDLFSDAVDEEWEASFWRPNPASEYGRDQVGTPQFADTAPLAICLAALEAVEAE